MYLLQNKEERKNTEYQEVMQKADSQGAGVSLMRGCPCTNIDNATKCSNL